MAQTLETNKAIADLSPLDVGTEPQDERGRMITLTIVSLRTNSIVRALFHHAGVYSKNGLPLFSCSEVACLVVDAIYLDPGNRVACLSTALGWILWALFDYHPLLLCIVIALATPCSLQLLGRTGMGQIASGSLLLAVALESQTQILFIQVLQDNSPDWLYLPYAFCLIPGLIAYFSNANARREFVKGLSGCKHCVLQIIERVIAPFGGAFICGWCQARNILLRKMLDDDVNNPMMTLFGYMAAVLYLMTWMIVQDVNGPRQYDGLKAIARREARFCLVTTSLVCSLMIVALYFLAWYGPW